MTPVVAIATAAGGTGSATDLTHLLPAGCRIDGQTRRLASLIDPQFLAEAGWNPSRLVFNPPPGHRLLGRPICRAAGCETTAMSGNRICHSCARRLAASGLGEDQISLLPARLLPVRGVVPCRVTGCGRESDASTVGLCRWHQDQQHGLRVTVGQFLGDPRARPLPAARDCAVASCPRQRRHPDGQYCQAHQLRVRARRSEPRFDETRWRLTDPPIGCGGQISLRGLPPLVVAQVVLGLQRRCRADRVRTKEADLRAVVDDLRRRRVTCLDDYTPPVGASLAFNGVFHGLAGHARRALLTPESEILGDVWDLTVFGHSGTVSFTGITQSWLREAGKRWAAEDLPRRRVRSGRRTTVGLSVRHHIGALTQLSESLRMRPDRGLAPTALGRADMEAFLHRLAFLESAGRISADARVRACREVRVVLTWTRACGLTRPGAVAAGLGEDFTLGVADIPVKPETAEAGRDLPPEIMRTICSHLDELTSPVMRAAVELAIDTGRRPEEICDLAFDCLTRDDDGLPVLVYDNHKANRVGRRLPISEHTATVITTAQQAARSRYPHTSVGELKLLPTDRRNPNGDRAITAFTLSFVHRLWVTNMPTLLTVDGVEYDKTRIVLYAYRHTYAQRHADAGVGIDVLRELMDHRRLDTTKGYYQVGKTRRREAVDRVAAMQFDRHGNRIWRQAQALIDSQHTRRMIGEVVVPFGICTEPSNVNAGGHACPYRFRCAGCDHFRTDVSYLPDLHAYLDDLLRNREKLLASNDIDDWARAEATPSTEEITRIRRLIARITTDLDDLPPDDRTQIEQAVTAVRRHRGVTLGMPTIRRPEHHRPAEHTP
jgi:integrase